MSRAKFYKLLTSTETFQASERSVVASMALNGRQDHLKLQLAGLCVTKVKWHRVMPFSIIPLSLTLKRERYTSDLFEYHFVQITLLAKPFYCPCPAWDVGCY